MQERLNSEIQGKFCPLCSHELTENEKQFYPCSCKYQVKRSSSVIAYLDLFILL